MTFAACAVAAYLLLMCPPAEAYPAGIKGHSRRLGESLACAAPAWLCGQAGIDLRFEAALLLSLALAVPFAVRALCTVVVVRVAGPATVRAVPAPAATDATDAVTPATLEAALQQARGNVPAML